LPKKKKASFLGDTVKLSGGTFVSQLIGFIALPLLTRIFSPEAFGVAGLINSITATLSVFVCMSYESALVLPKETNKAINLLAGCFIITVATFLLSALIIWVISELFFTNAGLNKLRPYLWVIPFSALISGINQILRFWNIRTAQFGRIAVSTISTNITSNAFMIGAGSTSYPGTGILILGTHIVGGITRAIFLLGRFFKDYGPLLKKEVSINGALHEMKRYRKFPTYVAGANLLSRFTSEAPILFLTYFFSSSIVGYYIMCRRILAVPGSLIGNSLSQVFFQRGASARTKESLRTLISNVLRSVLPVALAGLVVVSLVGDVMFSYFLGDRWETSGMYAQILAFGIFISFSIGILKTLFLIFELQEKSLLFDVCLLLINITSLVIGGLFHNIFLAICLMSFLTGISYLLLLVWLIKVAELSPKSLVQALWPLIKTTLPLITMILISRYVLELNSLCLLAISLLGMFGFVLIFVKTDPFLREKLKRLSLKPHKS